MSKNGLIWRLQELIHAAHAGVPSNSLADGIDELIDDVRKKLKVQED